MKIKPAAILSIFITLILCSCIDAKKKDPEETKTAKDFVKVDITGQYSISIPSTMQKTTALNSDAFLQYQNIHEEIYTVVIDEPKQELIDTIKELGYGQKFSIDLYRDIQLERLAERMQINHQTEPAQMTISGLDAEMVELDAKVDNIEEDLTYFLTFIEGKEKIYTLMFWTLKSKKQDQKNTFLTIVKSFELTD